MRLPHECLVFLYRRVNERYEVLLLHRAPTAGAYWHGVAGALHPGETSAQAAVRETREETGLMLGDRLIDLKHRYAYMLDDEPEYRAWYAPDVTSVTVDAFAGRVGINWDPQLNDEHDQYGWFPIDEAVGMLRWPDARQALVKLVQTLESSS